MTDTSPSSGKTTKFEGERLKFITEDHQQNQCWDECTQLWWLFCSNVMFSAYILVKYRKSVTELDSWVPWTGPATEALQLLRSMVSKEKVCKKYPICRWRKAPFFVVTNCSRLHDRSCEGICGYLCCTSVAGLCCLLPLLGVVLYMFIGLLGDLHLQMAPPPAPVKNISNVSWNGMVPYFNLNAHSWGRGMIWGNIRPPPLHFDNRIPTL